MVRSRLAIWLEETFREVPRPKTMSHEDHQREHAEWERQASEARASENSTWTTWTPQFNHTPDHKSVLQRMLDHEEHLVKYYTAGYELAVEAAKRPRTCGCAKCNPEIEIERTRTAQTSAMERRDALADAIRRYHF